MRNLKCSLDTCYHWVVTRRNSRIYHTSTVAPKFSRFEFSWLQHVEAIAREGVHNKGCISRAVACRGYISPLSMSKLDNRTIHSTQQWWVNCTVCATYKLKGNHCDGFDGESTLALCEKNFERRSEQFHDKCWVILVNAVIINTWNAFCNVQPKCQLSQVLAIVN